MCVRRKLVLKYSIVWSVCGTVLFAFLNLLRIDTPIAQKWSTSKIEDDFTTTFSMTTGHRHRGPLTSQKSRPIDDGHIKDHDKFCMGLCPDSNNSTMSQMDYVKALIDARMKNFPSNKFRVIVAPVENVTTTKFVELSQNCSNCSAQNRTSYFDGIWNRRDSWITSRKIVAPNDIEYFNLMTAINSARIVEVSTPTLGGTELKMMLMLEGGEWALWKPKILEREDIVEHSYGGPDRHNGEVAAFHLGHLLGLDRTPFTAGRILNIRSELYDLADDALRKTFFVDNNPFSKRFHRHCFYGTCNDCKKLSAPVCSDEGDLLEGSLSLWLPETYGELSNIMNPWAQAYYFRTWEDPDPITDWEMELNFCQNVLRQEPFNKPSVFLDFMEMAVFDYLIGNGGRHHLEYHENVVPENILLLDNGKSFGNPNVDDVAILAPIFQCCHVRRRFYRLLFKYSKINLGALLNDRYLKRDSLYPVLTGAHLEAINRRLIKVLNVLDICTERHGRDTVLVDDA